MHKHKLPTVIYAEGFSFVEDNDFTLIRKENFHNINNIHTFFRKENFHI